jgi:hypothetical protein
LRIDRSFGFLRPFFALWLLSSSPWCAASAISDYQIDLGNPPASVVDASSTRAARELIALRAAACGQEIPFLQGVVAGNNDEDIVKLLVAKVAWLRRGEGSCVAQVGMRLTSPLSSAPRPSTSWASRTT